MNSKIDCLYGHTITLSVPPKTGVHSSGCTSNSKYKKFTRCFKLAE